jgi:hypothetical protein
VDRIELLLSFFHMQIAKCYIITGIGEIEKKVFVKKLSEVLDDTLHLVKIKSPKSFYDTLAQNTKRTLLISDDILSKRKNYIDLLEGAVCSSPDSCRSWEISYLDWKSFYFRGVIIILTHYFDDEIRGIPKLEYISRDCITIDDPDL